MSKDLPRHYWDSCTFINIIQGNEPDGNSILRSCVSDVRHKKLIVISSTLTIAEVVKPRKDMGQLSKSDEKKAKEAFHKSIQIYELTRKIAERARGLQWYINIKPPDSIHLATAEFAEVDRFETYDDKLINAVESAGDSIWNHKFDIGHPYQQQTTMF